MYYIVWRDRDTGGMGFLLGYFKHKKDAEKHLNDYAVVDGPDYEIIYLNNWKRKTSNPTWIMSPCTS